MRGVKQANRSSCINQNRLRHCNIVIPRVQHMTKKQTSEVKMTLRRSLGDKNLVDWKRKARWG
jgi:hypothetical protein